ncbi:MAG: small-conductance mechanosensitive channel [Paracoccaceae bacterium]
MEPQIDPVTIDQFQAILSQFKNFGIGLIQPWRLYQIAILIGILGFGQLVSLLITGRMNNWMRTLEGRPKWQLRVLLLLNQRIRSIAFVIVAWTLVYIMREITWPSRSYLIGLVAELATAWLLISIATRLMRNRSLRRIVRWAAWVFVTLNILGLTDFAATVLDEFALDIGATRLSALVVLKVVVVLFALMAGARLVSNTAAHRIGMIDDMSPSMQVLSIKALQLFVYGVALTVGLQSVGFDMTSLTVLTGAIGLGLGFGLQKVISNLVSGVILLLDKSIKPGDVISIDDTFGWISSLGARYVSVLTRNGTEFLIPNEDLITNKVVNWSHSSDLVRLDINFGVSYDSDPHQVKKVAAAAPLTVDRIISNPAPVCHVVELGDSSIDFVLRFWIRDPSKGLTNVRGNVYLALWDALKAAEIEIPFPRRDVRLLPAVPD